MVLVRVIEVFGKQYYRTPFERLCPHEHRDISTETLQDVVRARKSQARGKSRNLVCGHCRDLGTGNRDRVSGNRSESEVGHVTLCHSDQDTKAALQLGDHESALQLATRR